MELKEQARQYYETHRLSLQTLANQSESLLGSKVSLDTLKKWSQSDGGWKKPELSVDKRFEFMANLLFEKIEEEGKTMTMKDLVAAINQYLNLALKAPMDLDASAKPTLDEILDTIDALDKRTNTSRN